MLNISENTILIISISCIIYILSIIFNNKFTHNYPIKFRSIDMGIKLNPCSYEIIEYIKRDKNIKMFEQLIKLFSKINYDVKLPTTIMLMRQKFNKPIVYGIKNCNLTKKFNLEFYAYIGDHNITHTKHAEMFESKLDFLQMLEDVLIKLYNIKPFVYSKKLMKFIKKTNLIIISFNVELNGTLIPKLNLYTENIIRINGKNTPVVLTFEFDLNKHSIKYSNIAIPYQTKADLLKSDLVKSNDNRKFLSNIPNGHRYLIHKKNDDVISIYVVNPKFADIKKFMTDNKFNSDLINYYNKNSKNKSMDIAYTISNGKIIKTSVYDCY
jgi:hypothetical protein